MTFSNEELKNLRKLPPVVFTTLRTTGQVIAIKRGESGYYPIDTNRTAEELNGMLEPVPTSAQVEAMEVGSMFGWYVYGADVDVIKKERASLESLD